MSPAAQPPKWTADQLEEQRLVAVARFREERMQEPLEAYLEATERYRAAVETVLESTVDLSQVREQAVELLSDPDTLIAVRYLSGPPISLDDLKVLAEATLAPSRLKADPDMARRIIDTVLLGLDRNRFPWVGEDREPTESERLDAAMSTAAMIASSRVMTERRNEQKGAQEEAVKQRLRDADFVEVAPRKINTLDDAPEQGEFCGESMFGGRKADIVTRLWDRRVMPTECKVSNSSTNSVKRLNNDAAVKAGIWIGQFGTAQTLPAAVLSGVYKRHNLEQAQDRGLTLWWAHDLDRMAEFIEATKSLPT